MIGFGEWIKVEDRLPALTDRPESNPDGATVFVLACWAVGLDGANPGYSEAWFDPESDIWWEREGVTLTRPTHWMSWPPKPEPTP